jgi:hypothetical protein
MIQQTITARTEGASKQSAERNLSTRKTENRGNYAIINFTLSLGDFSKRAAREKNITENFGSKIPREEMTCETWTSMGA